MNKIRIDAGLILFVRNLPGGSKFLKGFKEKKVSDIAACIREADWDQFQCKKLDLSHKKLKIIPPEFGRLLSLEVLELGGNNLQEIPPEIGKLINLRRLGLASNQLTHLPDEIKNLNKLKEVDITANRFLSYPKQLGGEEGTLTLYKNYCRKNIGGCPKELNSLKEVGYKMAMMSVLRETGDSAEAAAEAFQALGSAFGEAADNLDKKSHGAQRKKAHLKKKLAKKNEKRAAAQEDPADFHLWQFINAVSGSNIYIQKVLANKQKYSFEGPIIRTAGWGFFETLTELTLSTKALSVIPPEIGRLARLTRLELAGNQLETLPPEIGELSSLEVLDLRCNQLHSLPNEMVRLKKLWALDLSYNDFKRLPRLLGDEEKLYQLFRNYLLKIEKVPLYEPPELMKLIHRCMLYTAIKGIDSDTLFNAPEEVKKDAKRLYQYFETKHAEFKELDNKNKAHRKKRRGRALKVANPEDKSEQIVLPEPKKPADHLPQGIVKDICVRPKKKKRSFARKVWEKGTKNSTVAATALTAKSLIKGKKPSIPKKFAKALNTAATMKANNIRYRTFMKLAANLGGAHVRTTGDHHIMQFPSGGIVPIPGHNPVNRRTARSILDRLEEEGQAQLAQYRSL